MQADRRDEALRQEIFKKTVDQIARWTAKRKDVYALTYYCDAADVCDCETIEITLGYNTESEVREAAKEVAARDADDPERAPDDPREARWFFSWFLQADDFYTLSKDADAVLGEWLAEASKASTGASDDLIDDAVWNRLKRILGAAIQELHRSGALTEAFGSEIPVLIYDEWEESDYNLDNLNFNMEANGPYLPQEFIDYYREIVES